MFCDRPDSCYFRPAKNWMDIFWYIPLLLEKPDLTSKLAISDLVQLMKGRSSHKVQRESHSSRNAIGADGSEDEVFFKHQRSHSRRQRISALGKAYRKSCRREPTGGLVKSP